MQEIWKYIDGYENYQISNFGNVKALAKNTKMPNGGIMVRKEKLLKYWLNAGYYKIGLCKNGKRKTMQIHQLVAMAFLNHKPDGHKIIVDHIDNNPLNNKLENLQLISPRKNCSKDRINGSSKYVGVHWCKNINKWISRIYINGKKKHLGIFDNELLASESYKIALNECN